MNIKLKHVVLLIIILCSSFIVGIYNQNITENLSLVSGNLSNKDVSSSDISHDTSVYYAVYNWMYGYPDDWEPRVKLAREETLRVLQIYKDIHDKPAKQKFLKSVCAEGYSDMSINDCEIAAYEIVTNHYKPVRISEFRYPDDAPEIK